MADWLALHGVTAGDCLGRLLPLAGENAGDPPPDPALADPLPVVLAALRRALPVAAPLLDRLPAEADINLAPDLRRFPRAFTLRDAGRGRPYVSCPLRGRLSDLLTLGHEAGHACQSLIRGAAAPDVPPVLRELAAYLAEELVLAGLAQHALGQTARALHAARTARIMGRNAASLRRGLQDPQQAVYDYGWNYPLARDLAARVQARWPDADKWQVIGGHVALPDLWAGTL